MRVIMPVRMRMRMRMSFAGSGFGRAGRRDHEFAGFDALGRDQGVGELANFPDRSAQKNHFEASGVIQVDVRGRDDHFQMVVLDLGQTVADLGRMVIVNHGDDPHRQLVIAGDRFGDEGGPHEPADGLTASGVAVLPAIVVETVEQLAPHGDAEPDKRFLARIS